MDYKAEISKCTDRQLASALLRSIELLFKNDMTLFENDTNEESIASLMARYLSADFPERHVDDDYNRMGDVPKTVTWDERPSLVRPDIIIHRRGTNEDNLLAVEIKLSSNVKAKDDDVKKLRAYRRELAYTHALFIRFGVKRRAGEVTECEWVEV